MPSQVQDTFERVLAGTPAEQHAARRAAFEQFTQGSMPTGREEAWRYVELDFDIHDLPVADEAGSPGESPFLAALDPATITITDGFVSLRDQPSGNGVQVTVGAHAATNTIDTTDIFLAAARALAPSAAHIVTARGAVAARPIVIDVSGTQPGSVSFPIIAIDLESNSELSLIIVYRSEPGGMVISPQVSANVGDGARLRITTVQSWDDDTVALGYQRIRLGRDADVRIGEVGLGGRLGRLDLAVALEGDGANSDLTGIYFGDGDQVLDYRIVINHHGKNTSSNVFLKGAVEDRAESVFTGLLKIWPDATNTSTFETNRNLVLSEDAKAHSVPNLEILCDDVVCGHGSTVGPLESDHLYYLQSRGLNRDRAERMLLRGFFEEVIDRLPAQDLAPAVRAAVNEKFEQAQAEGRIA